TKPFEDSTVAKVLDLVENASSRKAPVEAFITKFARYYTPIVVCLALLLAVIPPLAGFGHFTDWLYRAMIFLVISCPCALVISVPLSLFAGIGSASREGILVKGSNYLEALASVETFAFDKTGTLTHGRFTVSKVVPAAGIEASKLIEIATAAESLSNHPIAKSIVAYGKDHLVSAGSVGTPENYEEISGKGISCIYKGNNVYCGNDKLIRDLDLSVPEESEIGSLVHVAIKLSNDEYRYLGHIVVADTPRENSAETVSALKALGIENTIMLTGDKREVAEAVGNSLGLSKVYSELLPGDKVDAIEAAMTSRATTPSYTSTANAGVSTASGKKSRGHLAFVGDGINDAPVLARADVGIAMGAFGSDAAIEAADVVIMADDISKLVTVTKIARKTLRICKENVVFALAVKFAIMALGAVGLASMWAAVFADVGVAVIAILNALRAMRIR
ncbi:MAG: heavy metal translocating P-type ATPase, partial [Clostridia bacterium]|nr:heavy metal translocating P-type ATPase [Clostridia bacterium]